MMCCSLCGGLVLWRGLISNLTHTECERCGAVNAHVCDEPETEDETNE